MSFKRRQNDVQTIDVFDLNLVSTFYEVVKLVKLHISWILRATTFQHFALVLLRLMQQYVEDDIKLFLVGNLDFP